MNHRDGSRCSSCGEVISVPRDSKLRTVIVGASGKPNMHVLSLDGTEVHRCEAQTQIEQSAEDTEAQMS